MEPLESHLVPLPDVIKRYDPHQVQDLDGEKTKGEADQFVFEGRWEFENGCKKNDGLVR